MIAATQPPPRPTLGVVSLLIPIVVSLVTLVLDRNPWLGNGLNGYAGLFLGVFMFMAMAGGGLVGAACGVLAWARGERLRVLGGIGVVLNLTLLFHIR